MNFFLKFLIYIHMKQYLFTNGRFQFLNFGLPCLIIHTKGAKSGIERRTVLSYYEENEALYIVASNGGSDRNPSWYFNLKKNPKIIVKIRSEKVDMVAEELTDQNKVNYWKKINISFNGIYDKYQKNTERSIPVFKLIKNNS